MTRRPPHLVFVTSLVPDGKPATGFEIANAAVIGALRRQGARVTVVGFARPGSAIRSGGEVIVLGHVDPATHNAGVLDKFRWLARSASSGLPVGCAKLRVIPDQAMEAALERAGPADAYVLNAVQIAGAFEHLFRARKFFYVAHNVEHRSAAENAEAATGMTRRWLYRREARLLRKVEERLARAACFLFAFSEEDRKELALHDRRRSAALPLVTRSEPFLARGDRRPECDAALIGTWTWQPNLVGLEWFLDEVVARLPDDFRVRVAGPLPAGFAARYPDVQFAGRVADAAAFVRSARVVPLVSRAGTGVQLKTIEAFELGVPTVATRRAVRGIAGIPENCVIADDPARFASALTAAARGGAADMDGAAFHRAQTAALDRAVADALRGCGFLTVERAA